MSTYKTNIESDTIQNLFYRKILFTGPNLQLAVMSLEPGEDIPFEIHDGDQFIRVEQGQAYVIVEDEEFILNVDDIIIIPQGSEHYVSNNSLKDDLKLYSIYSPPEHPKDKLNISQPKKNQNDLHDISKTFRYKN